MRPSMTTLIKIVGIYALLALALGPLWNMSVSREPWLTISGLFGVSGFAFLLLGMGFFIWKIA